MTAPSITFTTQVAVAAAVDDAHRTVITVEPSDTPVTLPLFTRATELSKLCQSTALSVAFSGITVALSSTVSPIYTLIAVLSSVTPVASMGTTATTQLAL